MPEVLGRYRLLSLLATGGMGEVFLARQEGPGGFSREVVVKRILRHLAQDQGFIDLFLNEARLAARLQHPNIVQVFGLEHEEDTWFIAMEYVHGRSLRAVVHEAKKKAMRIPVPVAVRLCSQALQGLHFAHELQGPAGEALGIVHRDVSPENILVAFSGVTKLVDFGIAKAMTGATTFVGRPKGKLAYIAPELVKADAKVDRRADLFAMGVVLHEVLTLERPPSSPATVDDLGKPRPPFVPRADLPGPLNDVLAKALASDPADRFPTALAMSEQLEAWLSAAGHAVLPSEVNAFLVDLYGRAVVETTPAVEPGRRGGTDMIPVYRGGVPPMPGEHRTEPMVSPPPPRPEAPAPPRPPRTQAVVALVVGTLTALVVLVPTVLTLVSSGDRPPDRPPGVAAPVPPVAPAPQPTRQFQPLELSVDPAGPRPPPQLRRPVVRTGRVDVRVNPYAEVFFNGRSYGTTPIPPIEVPAGTATFTLRNSKLGVVRKVSVKVNAGTTVVLKANLFKK